MRGHMGRVIALCVGLALAGAANAGSAAESRLRAGDMAGAIPLARAEAANNPGDLDAQELYIDVAIHLGLHALVLPDYQGRVKKNPNDADSHYLLGRVALDAVDAERHYREALRLDPAHARAPMGLAAVQRATGKLAEAEQSYRQALARDETLSEAWAGLQATLLQQDRVDDAAQEARRALAAVPDEPDAYVAVATLEPGYAVEVLKVGVKRVPDDPRLRNLFARHLLEAGDGRGARRQTEAALALAPGYPEADFLRMVSRSMEDKNLDAPGWKAIRSAQDVAEPGPAQDAWSQLVSAYPDSPVPWLGRGKIRAVRGDLNGARDDLARAVSLASDEVEVQASYGLLMLRGGEAAKAVPWLAKAAAARPQDGSLAAAHVRAAQLAGPPEDARKVASNAYRAHPHSRAVVLATAQVMSQQGDVNGAYMALRDALPKIPDPVIVVALAAAARDAGNLDEAADILDRLARTLKSDKVREVAEQVKQEALAAKVKDAPGP